MKTVMKKMFCLLLVAVLLVSAVPAAFAAEPCTGEHTWGEGVVEVPATCTNNGRTTFTCTLCEATTSQYPDPLGHTEVVDAAVPATCTTDGKTEGKHCSACGEVLVAQTVIGSSGHTEVVDAAVPATCSAAGKTEGKHCSACGTVLVAQNEIPALSHDYGTDSVCDDCGYCKHCGKSDGTHPNTCPNSSDYETTCAKCGNTYLTAEGHPECEVCEGCHTTKKCPYCAVCWDEGDKVKTHKTADHCIECGKTDGTHKNTCSDAPEVGNATVKVHVRLYTSNVLTDTVELLTYKDYKDARIYSSVAAHEDLIRAKLEAKYPGYKWSGNLYDNPGKVEDTKETIGKGTTVYINAYSDQDLVYIYVHNSRSMNNLRIIQLDGKKVGETITKSEVKKAVSKYFNYSSLSMYSEQAWEDYVDGESVESVSSLKITTDPYFIDVKISGAASTSSGSGYTADSSNPKTGDEIFAPIMILGLSASALAVLFYLNKKRAF